MSIDGEQAWQTYHRVLYPEYARGQRHWYGKWKTSEMCMGLFGTAGCPSGVVPESAGTRLCHPTAVVTYHASPVRSMTVKVCLQCLWVSGDLSAEHDEFS